MVKLFGATLDVVKLAGGAEGAGERVIVLVCVYVCEREIITAVWKPCAWHYNGQVHV